ncbi:TPA: hypothetical protein HA295_05345 [Candidatus Woesearchaeota archaeon]|nr:hypothetical protein [Candidatus Woesearchaeota archaeon]HII66171.1 hypothetical protein [Candidatus Woesearchaeota archaeon]
MKQPASGGRPALSRDWEEVYVISQKNGRLKKASAVVYPLSIGIPKSAANTLSSVLQTGDSPFIVAGITGSQDKQYIDSIIKATFSGGLRSSHPAAFPFLSQTLTANGVPNVLDPPLPSYYAVVQYR